VIAHDVVTDEVRRWRPTASLPNAVDLVDRGHPTALITCSRRRADLSR
jgi:hypothetical protein